MKSMNSDDFPVLLQFQVQEENMFIRLMCLYCVNLVVLSNKFVLFAVKKYLFVKVDATLYLVNIGYISVDSFSPPIPA